MNPFQLQQQLFSRRAFLGSSAMGLGSLALSSLLGQQLGAAESHGGLAGALPAPHFPAKAKRVIYLHMLGAPSQHDLLDHKPLLQTLDGKKAPRSILPERSAFLNSNPNPPLILGSPIRSMVTDQFNHAPAELLLHTGFPVQGRPSTGAWVTYGLGSENSDLPAYMVLLSGSNLPAGGTADFGAGFLPSVYQGVRARSKGDPVLFLSNPEGMDRAGRRRHLDALAALNHETLKDFGDPETATRIAQYEMAFRMQASVPEVMDISKEPQAVLDAYGAKPGAASFANNCLLARKLCESGVRFVQLFDWGWDSHGTGHHDDLEHSLVGKCRQTDQPIAALLKDLEQRGLLEDTLVVWTGEFGRTAVMEARNGNVTFKGRDHHPGCFTSWIAGGGVKAGTVYGQTDEWGQKVVENPVHVYDFQATLLHLLGMDHTRLTYRFQGLDFRLTNFRGNVVKGLLA
ncbi:MAG: hypothetical protein RL095_3705 [Verrucomicrobiota bacterium]